MSPSSSAVSEAANLIRDRIRELDAERAQLVGALTSLGGGTPARRGPGRPRSAGRRSGGGSRRRRGGTRADQAVKLIQQNPSITASDIAKRMRIKPNYLYRVLGDLQKEGRVRKNGRAYTAP